MSKEFKVFDESGRVLTLAEVLAMLSETSFNEISNCTRLEVIDDKGRSYVNWQPANRIAISMQDEGRTIKVFVKTEQ